ncbi:SusC/RagA family TonB-linked outer membrane protein [Chitinophaga sp. NPDC101104]|uniref:SusC/RagA family TonB-linked outer membrane protein n=1 Tax=Chitinophaga sp. NPDC101104 TaxID=3390561 RepID=UPI003D04609E
MKLTAILMLAAALHVSAAGFSQTITLSRKNAPLGRIFSEIQKQSGYSLLYDMKLIRSAGPVSIDVQNASVAEVLEKCLQGHNLTFVINNNIIVIREKAATAAVPMAAVMTGSVTDDAGAPIPGASVELRDLRKGTVTDAQGRFRFADVPAGQHSLRVSFIGYETLDTAVQTGNEAFNIAIVLKPAVNKLKELVVVTALGIRKQARSVTYNVQTVSGAELNNVKDPSLVNTLAGKVAGMAVSNSSSGPGGATKVVMRGNKSIYGNNNALFVVDGIPLPDLFTQQKTDGFSVPGGSDGIANINPDDIESVTALTGASSAALYGSQAANGVILLTTKKGRSGKPSVNYSFNANYSKPLLLPDFQSSYGATPTAGSFYSWGDKQAANADNKSFFQTGDAYTHAVNVTAGNDHSQNYFSAAAVNANGIVPKNSYARYNFNARNTTSLLNDRLSLDVNAQYVNMEQDNVPVQGQYYNPLVGVYLFPREHDFNSFRQFEQYDVNRNFSTQRWPYSDPGMMLQNPFWVVNRNTNSLQRNRFIGSVAAKYTITPWLSVTGRAKQDRTNDVYEARSYASTPKFLAGDNGRYDKTRTSIRQTYADIMFTAQQRFGQFSLQANVGSSIQDVVDNTTGWANGYLLQFANFFSFANIDFTRFAPFEKNDRLQTQAVFGTAQLGFRDMLYVDVTARNEWSSALAFTKNPSYFYPSVGLSAVLSEMVKFPEAISFAKLRASYSEVANSIPIYISMPTITLTNGGSIQAIHAKPFSEMQPERTRSFEVGLDSRFLNDKLSFNLTYYKSSTLHQYFKVEVSPSVGYNAYYVNAGNIENRGIEASLGYNGKIGQVQWTSTLNYGLNRNKVVEMMDYSDPFTGTRRTQEEFVVSDFAGYRLIVRKGGSYGDIYAKDVKRTADGSVALNNKGVPEIGDYKKVGNANPRYLMGWNNSFNWKQFQLSFLVDARIGGEVVSTTEAIMDNFGVSQRTAEARNNGGVKVGDKTVPAKDYYQSITGATSSALALYTYSATNVRLRELSLGYSIPAKALGNKVRQLQVSLVGRNLWLIHKKAPYDPEITAFTTNQFQGYDYFGLPSQRNLGVNVKVTF